MTRPHGAGIHPLYGSSGFWVREFAPFFRGARRPLLGRPGFRVPAGDARRRASPGSTAARRRNLAASRLAGSGRSSRLTRSLPGFAGGRGRPARSSESTLKRNVRISSQGTRIGGGGSARTCRTVSSGQSFTTCRPGSSAGRTSPGSPERGGPELDRRAERLVDPGPVQVDAANLVEQQVREEPEHHRRRHRQRGSGGCPRGSRGNVAAPQTAQVGKLWLIPRWTVSRGERAAEPVADDDEGAEDQPRGGTRTAGRGSPRPTRCQTATAASTPRMPVNPFSSTPTGWSRSGRRPLSVASRAATEP